MFPIDPFKNCLQDGTVTLQCIPNVIGTLIGLALAFASTVAVIMIIIGGIKFMTSGGDAKQAETAQRTLTLAVGGLVLIIFSFFILTIISSITNVKCIRQFGFDTCKVSTTP